MVLFLYCGDLSSAQPKSRRLYFEGLIVHFLEDQHVGPSWYILLVVLFPKTMIKLNVKVRLLLEMVVLLGLFALKLSTL
jgi:hypothetical protein